MRTGLIMLIGMAAGNILGVVMKFGFKYGGVALVLLLLTGVLYFGEQIYLLYKIRKREN